MEVRRLDPAREGDFFAACEPACACVAWWVDDWDDWGQRTPEQNRRLRTQLFARGEHDGYLLYDDAEPLGWCQAGPRDRLAHLCRRYALEPDAEAWALTCLHLVPAARGRGLAHELVGAVVTDLRRRGVRRVEAFPDADDSPDEHSLWRGPHRVFERLGFAPGGQGRWVLELQGD